MKELGAHHVIDHGKPLSEDLKRIGAGEVDHVFSLTRTDEHWAEIVASMKPRGRIAVIDDPASPLDVMALKAKSLAFFWEMMFTRSMFGTPDMEARHHLLAELAPLSTRDSSGRQPRPSSAPSTRRPCAAPTPPSRADARWARSCWKASSHLETSTAPTGEPALPPERPAPTKKGAAPRAAPDAHPRRAAVIRRPRPGAACRRARP
ncbi:zinc-binding dehydrogenase [Chelatococcus albus]|uniref:zinc-binding dehydrogenase n=1 Tax=Chelatococcus albus TaxID=3047466 RepID=UPI003BEEE7B7